MSKKSPASTSRRIKRSLMQDGISYVIGLVPGLSAIPIPFETIQTLIRALIKFWRQRSPLHFTDWELEDWVNIYFREIDSVVRLTYKGQDVLLPQVLVFDNTSRKLQLSQVELVLQKEPFELPDNIRALTETAFTKLSKALTYTNEQNLRLVAVNEHNDKLTLSVQPVEYRHYLHTNLVLDTHEGTTQSLREYLHRDGRLRGLHLSPLANNLGVNVLLFLADGSLLLQKRSKRVAFRRGELCPSASGTLSLTDMPMESQPLTQVPVLREAFEETGIKLDDAVGIHLLGITRELIRGGEPEMFFCGESRLSKTDLQKRHKRAKDSWETQQLLFFDFGHSGLEPLENDRQKHRFLIQVDRFIDEHLDNASIPLLTAIALWTAFRLHLQ